MTANRPGALAGLRVLDATVGLGHRVGAHLADLGGDLFDVPDPRASSVSDAIGAIRRAEVIVIGGNATELPWSVAEVRQVNTGALVVSVTPFGLTGPWAQWTVSDLTLQALVGSLSLAGRPGLPPQPAPGEITLQSALSNAAWLTLLGWQSVRRRSRGDVLDLSLFECAIQSFDPAIGMMGTAADSSATYVSRGRPDVSFRYPVFTCMDGEVRICILSERQWDRMLHWLGRPAELADPALMDRHARFARWSEIRPVIQDLFSTLERDSVVSQAAGMGIPAQALIEPSEGEVAWGRTGPEGVVRLTSTSSQTGGSTSRRFAGDQAGVREPSLPLDGVRVLDLGVIVVGAETGRLLADFGADVVKVENPGFPDGSRLPLTQPMSASFARGNRGKRSICLDLRTQVGQTLFLQLAATADIVLSNFRPGTMDKLGLDQARLHEANENLIIVESSAYGDDSERKDSLGYGPLVRAATGLTRLWALPEGRGYGDEATVYPDHIAARYGAMAIVAALIARDEGHAAQTVKLSQAGVIIEHLATTKQARENYNTPRIDYLVPAAGDDEWLAVSCADQEALHRLDEFLATTDIAKGRETRWNRKRLDELEVRLRAWAATRDVRDAAAQLQDMGVTAGHMVRQGEVVDCPQLIARDALGVLVQPDVGELVCETSWPRGKGLATQSPRPAPRMGGHTEEVLSEWLNLSAEQIATAARARTITGE